MKKIKLDWTQKLAVEQAREVHARHIIADEAHSLDVSPEAMARMRERLEGPAPGEAILRLGKDISVPGRQNFTVETVFFPFSNLAVAGDGTYTPKAIRSRLNLPARIYSFRMAATSAPCDVCDGLTFAEHVPFGERIEQEIVGERLVSFMVSDRSPWRRHMFCRSRSSGRDAPSRHARRRLGLPRPPRRDPEDDE